MSYTSNLDTELQDRTNFKRYADILDRYDIEHVFVPDNTCELGAACECTLYSPDGEEFNLCFEIPEFAYHFKEYADGFDPEEWAIVKYKDEAFNDYSYDDLYSDAQAVKNVLDEAAHKLMAA